MCEICQGRLGCPVCTPEPYWETCPRCNGDGYTYYNEDGYEITIDEYNALPEISRDKELCEECEGEGEIEYEPEYHSFYE